MGDNTYFEYREDPDGVVHAKYQGGALRLGYLVGTRVGDELEFRYTHVTSERLTASGQCRSRIKVLDDGRLRMQETLEHRPPIDELVVCHGDTCAPNTMIADDGTSSGHVDLGFLGTADRWADLAIATWSIDWNYGPGWDGHFLRAYGLSTDPDRTRYYRLLWDLGP